MLLVAALKVSCNRVLGREKDEEKRDGFFKVKVKVEAQLEQLLTK